MRALAALALSALLVTSCAEFSSYFRPPPTEVPFCALFTSELGSMQLDFTVTGAPAVGAAEAEAAARATTNGAGIVCSIRLARYDNLADHRALVWVVHLDGLAIPGAGGSLAVRGTQPPPPILRRALVLVTVDEPATPIAMLATGR